MLRRKMEAIVQKVITADRIQRGKEVYKSRALIHGITKIEGKELQSSRREYENE